MKRAAALTCAALAVVTAGVFAQTAPNFAGKWTRVADASGRAGGIGGLGVAATVVQDATSLTITRTAQNGEFTTTYNLDGSESRNTVNIGTYSIGMVSKVTSEAGKLIVNTVMSFEGHPVETSMTLSFNPVGNLVVESTRSDLQGGADPSITKMTYKKN
jgi:hypothetical protein